MMRAARLLIVFSIVAGVISPAFAAKPVPPKEIAKPLSPKEIKSDFGTGKPFKGVTVPGGESYLLTLKADGSAKMTITTGTKTSETGKWRVSTNGYCSTWGKAPEHCYQVEKNGKTFDVLNASHKMIAHWTA
jgi:hypothetical protein